MVIVEDQYSHLVYMSTYTQNNKPVKILTQLVLKVEIMEEKTHLSHEVVCFQMLDFGTSKSNSEVLNANSWKINSFSKTTLLHRELFLTMLYY